MNIKYSDAVLLAPTNSTDHKKKGIMKKETYFLQSLTQISQTCRWFNLQMIITNLPIKNVQDGKGNLKL